MDQEVNQFMANTLTMKIFKEDMLMLVYSQWQIMEETLIHLNILLP
jgi:hypothetical protein